MTVIIRSVKKNWLWALWRAQRLGGLTAENKVTQILLLSELFHYVNREMVENLIKNRNNNNNINEDVKVCPTCPKSQQQ